MKIFFETLGCPKNFNDTQVAEGILKNAGFTISESAETTDIIVVNTCGFINDAKTESIERIFEMSRYKEEGKKLVVSGCLSERYSKELFEEMPEVDCFIAVSYTHLDVYKRQSLERSMVNCVLLLPVPAITGTRPFTKSTTNRVSCTLSLPERVEASPVVPQTTNPSTPFFICHSTNFPMAT